MEQEKLEYPQKEGSIKTVKDTACLPYNDLAGGIAVKIRSIVNEKLDNRQKVKLLNEIVENRGFVTVSENTEKETVTKMFETVHTESEYNDNLNGAKALNKNGYDVYILPRVSGIKCFDYILAKDSKVYAAELKTIYGENSLSNRLKTANEQSDRVVLNIVGNATSRYVADEIKGFYLRNSHIKEIIVLKGGKPFYVDYDQTKDKKFAKKFMDRWAR